MATDRLNLSGEFLLVAREFPTLRNPATRSANRYILTGIQEVLNEIKNFVRQ